MEVYGAPSDDHKIDETHGTNLDTMQPRSCYPESKRLCEILCASWQKEYNVPVRVLRLTQTFGPGVRYDDGRVFAEFARCAMEGRDIVLKTAGATCRSAAPWVHGTPAEFSPCAGDVCSPRNG